MSVIAQYPKGTLSQLVDGLRAAPELAGYDVLFSAKLMSKVNSSPPRIVIYPTSGAIKNPRNKSTSIRDVERSAVAHLWGRDSDEVEYLEALLVQALVNQAAGGDPVSPAGSTPGVFWTATEDVWDQSDDSNRQGEEAYVVLTALAPLDKVNARTGYGIGHVDSVVIQQLTTTLTLTLGAFDATATVKSTVGLPPSGLVIIDSEQIVYTGTTATTLTGLARGANLTTPATHAIDAVVTPSQ